jgi:hypothetical protein
VNVAASVWPLAARICHAEPPAPSPNTQVFVNYVYSASLGFGGYSLSGLTANVYTLPLSDTLRGIPNDDWSLKLLFPVQLGIYDFKARVDGESISINQ